ncbi:MAG TPA: carbon-nitrogen family hydrolase [Arcobacter sp.]|jgi:predicted amidohydrolase|nr:carbon-nitrogen family hydrolase [Arcobacter sp.]
MKIALVSLDQIWENKEENLKACEEYCKKASKAKSNLIIFPEMTLTGFSMDTETNGENEKDSLTIRAFGQLAKDFKIAIIFGVTIKEKSKSSNMLYFVNEFGEILEFYQKIHPFSFANEDHYYEAGETLKTVSFFGVKFGLTICYDLRFSNLYQSYTQMGTDCIINIANWPAKRVEHWNTLLKARSIENQQFIIGVNRIGIDGNGLEYVESSNIFNPNGEQVEYQTIDGNRFKIFDIDFNETKEFRKTFNTVQDIKNIG